MQYLQLYMIHNISYSRARQHEWDAAMENRKHPNIFYRSNAQMTERPTVVDVKEAARIIGTSRTTVLRLEKRGHFAPRVRLSPRRFGYRLTDLITWIDSRREH